MGSDDVVDRRVLVNAVQGRQLLTAVSYVGSWHRNRGRRLVAFYAVLYYAGLRPAEAVGLRPFACHLPETGWGTLTLRETRPVSGKQWTDSGERHDRRGLKASEASADRPVPIPPILVAILRAHLKEFGTAKEGSVFGNERGGVVGSFTYWRVWEEAREYALPPERVTSPLAGRPVRPSTRLHQAVAERRCADRGGGLTGGRLAGSDPLSLPRMYRWPRGSSQREDRSRAVIAMIPLN